MLGPKESRGCEEKEEELGLGEKGLQVTQEMGRVEEGWSKPKRKRLRRSNKTQPGLLGPKPSNEPRCPGLSKSSPWIKPSKASAQAARNPGPTSSFTYRSVSGRPTQQSGQVGESSEMGAARATGVSGLSFADASSGEQLAGAGTLKQVVLGTTMGAEKDGECIGEAGQGEKLPTQRLATIPEVADDMGYEYSASTFRLSSIPASDEVLGCSVSPGKRSKSMADLSEFADEEGNASHTPEKQAKQWKVFQRRDSPSSKTMKSWVAERVCWNDGRGGVASSEAVSGCLCGMGKQEEGRTGVEGFLSQLEVEDSPGKHLEQGMDLVSPAAKVLDLVWTVKGTAGMSWDGQVGKLKQVFGHIVADKFGEGASSSTGAKVDGNMGMRDEDVSYEA
jgi:hypothetical protein